jgi:phospholipid/cholesterol/gamma-HCH transport system substrate-binding protein
MIRPAVKVQLLVFALITVLGVSYTAVRYLGLGAGLLHNRLKVYVDLADSGGIYSGADVDYRGVSVGRVGPLTLTRTGVRAELDLNASGASRIPADTEAVVADRSAVGEQYVELEPRVSSARGPYLADGSVITEPNTRIPVSTQTLLGSVDSLVKSVPTKDLSVVINELDRAFSGSAADLASLIDSLDRLIATANDIYPQTVGLLHGGETVLDSQRGQSADIKTFAANLASLAGEIRADDPSIRSALTGGVAAAQQGDLAIRELSPTLPVLLANLTTAGEVVTARIPALRMALILYPIAVSGSFTVVPGDGTIHFGLELNLNQPQACTKGYEATVVRYPQDVAPQPPNLRAGCTLPGGSPTDVRGSRNVPAPGPTPSVPPGADVAPPLPGAPAPSQAGATAGSSQRAGGSAGTEGKQGQQGQQGQGAQGGSYYIAGYDPATGIIYGPNGSEFILSSTGGERRVLGESSWEWLLIGSLAPSR